MCKKGVNLLSDLDKMISEVSVESPLYVWFHRKNPHKYMKRGCGND